jgi:hypothetical protein
MNEPKVQLVESKGFTINVPGVGAPVTIGAECNEVVVLVRLTIRPRDNVMNIDLDISACRDSTAVTGLDENTSTEFSRYWRSHVHDNSSNAKSASFVV